MTKGARMVIFICYLVRIALNPIFANFMDNSNFNRMNDFLKWLIFIRHHETLDKVIAWTWVSTQLFMIKKMENSGGIINKLGYTWRCMLNWTILTVHNNWVGTKWKGKYQKDMAKNKRFIMYVQPYSQRKKKNQELDALEKKASQFLNAKKVYINGEEKTCLKSCMNAADDIGEILGDHGKMLGKGSSVFLVKQLSQIKQYMHSNEQSEDWKNLDFAKFSGEHGQNHNMLFEKGHPPGADTDVEMYITRRLTYIQQRRIKMRLMRLIIEIDKVLIRMDHSIFIDGYRLQYLGVLNGYVNQTSASHHARTIKANKWSGMTTTRHSGKRRRNSPLVIYSGSRYQFGKKPFNLLRIRSKFKATNLKTKKVVFIYPEHKDISMQCIKNGIITEQELKDKLKYYVKSGNVYIPSYDAYYADVVRMIKEQRE